MVFGVKRWQVSLGALLLAFSSTAAHAQLRIVTYNTATAQSGTGTQTARLPYSSTILEAIGLENVNGLARPIDVLLVQEQYSLDVTTDSFVDILNDLYDPINRTMYARGTVSGLASSDFNPDPGLVGSGGRPAVIYNTQTVQLISESAFGAVGSIESGRQARQHLRYQFRPVGYDANADFYAYNSHYRAGDSGPEGDNRLLEATNLRNNSDALGEGTHAIYVGDYNIPSSNATMYQQLLASGPGQAIDPINTPGSWNDNSGVKNVHTQSPAATGEQIPGFAGGGMDDRFDFQLVTGEVLDGEGFDYLPGSYHAFGNNGTHNLNGSITTGTGASPAVLDALIYNSDHLPVVADYQLPAKMLASLGTVPTNVAQGAMVGIDVFVQNVASVLNANWADELDYTVSVSGALLGSASGINAALAAANTHQIFLNTGASGFHTGVVTVQATSQGAANSLFQFPVNFTVGGGNGGPVFGVIAKDTFDENEKLLDFAQTPAPGTYGDAGDGFEVYQVGVNATIPFQLVDDSATTNPADVRGIINSGTKTDKWFGVTDTVNGANVPPENPGVGTATWVFNVSGAIDMEVSIDMGAMGDFETADLFNWTYQFDSGVILPLFTSSVNEVGSQSYTMADGDSVSLDDPLQMLTSDNQTITLTNVLQTLTSPLSGLGETLTIQLVAKTDGGDEAYAFDNLIVSGTTFVEFLAADFNQDGTVDCLDLSEWQLAYGESDAGDADFDGDTDGADFLVWQRQFGLSSNAPIAATTAGAVPEPASILMLGGVALLALVCQRPIHTLNRLGCFF
jgi:hypothetical protein